MAKGKDIRFEADFPPIILIKTSSERIERTTNLIKESDLVFGFLSTQKIMQFVLSFMVEFRTLSCLDDVEKY